MYFVKLTMPLFAFFASMTAYSPWIKAEIPSIRVRLANSLDLIEVSGLDLRREVFQGQGEKKQFTGNRSLRFRCQKEGGGNNKQLSILSSITSPAKVLKWNGQVYKGEFEIIGLDDKGHCHIVNKIDLEDYLKSLLAREMNGKWPLEVLKAQAVAARTYALHTMKQRAIAENLGTRSPQFFDLESSERYQVSGHLNDETILTVKATKETLGEVLLTEGNGGRLTPAFYHSKCGGKTAVPEDIWDRKVEGYEQRVECPYCSKHGMKDWGFSFSNLEFRKIVRKMTASEWGQKKELLLKENFMVEDKGFAYQYLQVKNGDQKYSLKKIWFRKYLGREGLPGHMFKFSKYGGPVFVAGKGNGHGVGMCQFGALDLAQKGLNYKQILKYYFPNHQVVKTYYEK